LDTRRRSADISRVPARSRSCWRIRHCSPRQSPAAECGCLTDLHPGGKKSAERLRSGYPIYVVRVFDTRPQNGVKAGWPDISLRLSPPRLGWGPPAAGHFFWGALNRMHRAAWRIPMAARACCRCVSTPEKTRLVAHDRTEYFYGGSPQRLVEPCALYRHILYKNHWTRPVLKKLRQITATSEAPWTTSTNRSTVTWRIGISLSAEM
jgi:hypothetical protein